MGFVYRICPFFSKIRRIAFLSFLILCLVPKTGLYSAVTEQSIKILGKDTVFHLTHNDLKAGERLFYGLMRDQEGQPACVSCHNIKPVDEMNWSPSALDIAVTSKSKSLDDLRAVLLAPSGKRLIQAHAGYAALTETELVQLKGYLLEYEEQGGFHGMTSSASLQD